MDEIHKEESTLETGHAFPATELDQGQRKIFEVRPKLKDIVQNCNRPLLKLPNEVTCIIFEYALAVSASWHNCVDDSTRPPLFEVVASHVCRHWRSVALAYPRLWAHFRLGSKSLSLSSERFDSYLQRSANSELELWFKFCIEDNLQGFTALLQKATSHMQRWRRFSLFSDHQLPVRAVFATMVTVSIPRLEHFVLYAPSKDMFIYLRNGVPSLEPTVFKGGAPNLRSVSLDLTAYFLCMPPLQNVTTLYLRGRSYLRGGYPPSSILRDILSLPFLVNLSIAGVIYDDGRPYSDEKPITVAYLKHLRLIRSNEFIFLLPFMRAPALETLVISGTISFAFTAQPDGSDALLSDPYHFPALHLVCCINVVAHSAASTRQFAKLTASAREITFFQRGFRSESFFTFLAGCSLLEEKEALWKQVEVLNFDDPTGTFDDLLRFCQKRPTKSVKLRLSDIANSRLMTSSESKYAELGQSYELATLELGQNQLGQMKWPPSTNDHDMGLFTEEWGPFDENNECLLTDSDSNFSTDSGADADDG